MIRRLWNPRIFFSKSLFSHDGKNITLLTPSISQQEFIENSPQCGTIKENTDGFDIRPVYEKSEQRKITLLDNELVTGLSISPLEADHILPSDPEDELESSGDEYFPPTDDDGVESSSSDSSFEINIEDVHRTSSKNTNESITKTNVDEKGETDSKVIKVRCYIFQIIVINMVLEIICFPWKFRRSHLNYGYSLDYSITQCD